MPVEPPLSTPPFSVSALPLMLTVPMPVSQRPPTLAAAVRLGCRA